MVYRKNGGSTVTAKLGYLRSGNTNYKAPQSMPAGQEFNALWSGLANPCYPTNGLLYSGGTTYQTPAAIPSRC
ncbi:hypothetical protein [Streptomyces sp. NPDC090025]|uniref:hypothetical protein n=1 Tax=Streptomyces sp. NPDC090025 TaxID=3365922 RepID=UPI003832A8EF